MKDFPCFATDDGVASLILKSGASDQRRRSGLSRLRESEFFL